MKTIKSSRYKNVLADFEVLVDPNPAIGDPVIALKVDPITGGKPYLMPMDMRAARDMAVMIIDTIMKVQPSIIAEKMQPVA